MECRSRLFFTFVCAFTLLEAPKVRAVITANTPLKQVVDGAPFIFVAKVKEVLPDKPALVLEHDENIKGEAPFARMPVNLTGDEESTKGKHTQVILDRVDKDVPIIVVIAAKKGKKYIAFGYTEGTWFQMEGRIEKDDGKDVVRWAFLHAEPYLRRTFKGTTAELKQIISDAVKKKKDPPVPNEKEEPGFGPALKKTQLPPSRGVNTLLGVIQLPFIGLIAALAALFPTVFGGLALLMRRWMVLLSVAGLGSIIYTLHYQFPGLIRWTGLTTNPAIWIACAVLAGLGALWSARRYRTAIATGKSDEWQPRKIDRIALAVLIFVGLASLAFATWVENQSVLISPWSAIVICLVGTVAGSFFVFANYFRTRKLDPRPPLNISAETVMLWATVSGCAYLSAIDMGRAGVQATGVTKGDAVLVSKKGLTRAPALSDKPLWVFQPKENGELLSTPCITPERVVISVFHNEGFSKSGRVYALDPNDGKEVWRFPVEDEDEMLPVFCSPVYADSKIFVGEGFHQNENCRLLCLDESTGKKLWEFKTKSHVESTPAVADGMVVFGAGNDGIYVLNADSGEEIWHYAGEKGLHIDSSPAIADGLIYASSGYSKTHQVNRIFCLDPKTQTEVWGERTEQSAYGSPVIHEGKAYFATGNSTYSEKRTPAHGTVMSRDAKTGEVIWDARMPETVIARPAVDHDHVYVGCWDGNCYALDRKTGKQAWKNSLGSEVVAAPFLDRCSVCQASEVLYVAGKNGKIEAFSPQTGKFFWKLDLVSVNPDLTFIHLDGSPVVSREAQGTVVRRRIYVPAGLAQSDVALPVARLYCYEDVNDHSKP